MSTKEILAKYGYKNNANVYHGHCSWNASIKRPIIIQKKLEHVEITPETKVLYKDESSYRNYQGVSQPPSNFPQAFPTLEIPKQQAPMTSWVISKPKQKKPTTHFALKMHTISLIAEVVQFAKAHNL